MKKLILVGILIFLSCNTFAQDGTTLNGFSDAINSIHLAVKQLYDTHKGLYGSFIRLSSFSFAFGVLIYILNKTLGQVMRAEQVDFSIIGKPILIFFCLFAYPVLLNFLEDALRPIESTTQSMSFDSFNDMVEARREMIQGTADWEMFVGPDGEGSQKDFAKIYNESRRYTPGITELDTSMAFQARRAVYRMQNQFRMFLSELLRIFYQAAILCINFVRTYFLLVLAIVGPIPIALSIWFPGSFGWWVKQYIGKWLWVPLANILATMLNQLQTTIMQLNFEAGGGSAGDPVHMFTPIDVAGIIFLIIGIVSFFTVPSLANMVINSGTAGSALTRGATAVGGAAAGAALTVGGAVVGAGVGAASGVGAAMGAKAGAQTGKGTSDKMSKMIEKIDG